MINKKLKVCPTCGEEKYLWNRKIGCKDCVAKSKSSPKNNKTGKNLKRSPIKKISPKMIPFLERYREKRDRYLEEHTTCEVYDCGKPSNNLHHKKGRRGYADDWARNNDIKLIEDERFFMACCETCHPQRIHEHPKWARKNGYLL